MTFKMLTIELAQARTLALARRAGQGPACLFIHGALVDHADWRVGGAAAEGWKGPAVLVDRPGHGASRRPRFAGAPRAQARQIHEGLSAAGLRPPILVGHSYGALVALAYAELFAQEVRALLLLAPIAFPELRPFEHAWLGPRSLPFAGPFASAAAGATLDPPLLATVHRVMFAPQAPPADWRARFAGAAAPGPAAMVEEGEDIAALTPGSGQAAIDFAKVRAQTVIVAGAADRIVRPSRHAKPLHARLPGAQLMLLEGAGHMLHHSHPQIVAAQVERLSAAILLGSSAAAR